MAEKTVDTKRRLVVGGLLFAALVMGVLGGMPGSSSQSSMVPIAYADGCDGPHPPPHLDCPNKPTPTPTP